MIVGANKVRYKHIYVQSIKTKEKNIHKKFQHLKKRLTYLLSKGMPTFWNVEKNIIYQKAYHALLVQEKNEEDKFGDINKHLKGQTTVEKLNEDFDILS